MHYKAYAFSHNGRPTIKPVDPSISLNSLGQRNGFSRRDLQHVNALYCSRGEYQQHSQEIADARAQHGDSKCA